MMNLVEEKIKENLKILKIQDNRKNFVLAWTILPTFIVLAMSSWFLTIILGNVFGFLSLFLGFAFLVIGIVFFFVLRSQGKQIGKTNQKKMTSLNSSLHQCYFENNPQFFPKNLKFKGVFSSNFFNNNCLVFNWNTEKINWHISEDIVYGSSNQSTTYTLKFYLVSTAKKFASFDRIYISEGKTKSEGPFFKSESVIFNERFKVKGNNQVQIYKALTPKVMENFLIKEVDFLHPKTIRIYDGTVSITWNGSKSWDSWTPDPLDYSKISWNQKTIVGDVYRKIETDFARYLVIQNMLSPLDLYELV